VKTFLDFHHDLYIQGYSKFDAVILCPIIAQKYFILSIFIAFRWKVKPLRKDLRSIGVEHARCVFVEQKPLDRSWQGPIIFFENFC